MLKWKISCAESNPELILAIKNFHIDYEIISFNEVSILHFFFKILNEHWITRCIWQVRENRCMWEMQKLKSLCISKDHFTTEAYSGDSPWVYLYEASKQSLKFEWVFILTKPKDLALQTSSTWFLHLRFSKEFLKTEFLWGAFCPRLKWLMHAEQLSRMLGHL